MHDLKVMPAEPSADMLGNAMSVCTGFSGDYGTYNCYLSEDAAREVYQAFRVAAPAVQGVPVGWVNSDELDNMLDDRTATLFPVRTGFHGKPVYAAPQPAEQQPEPCQECGGDGAGGEHEEDCAMAQPDDDAVDRFAAAMKAKLNKKRQEGRGGWQSMTAEQLSTLLHEHVRKGDPVDVANLAMMLHQNGQRIEQQPAPDVARLVEALNAARDKLETVESRGHGERWTAREMWPGLFAQIDAALVGRSE